MGLSGRSSLKGAMFKLLNFGEEADLENVGDEVLLMESVKNPEVFALIVERYDRAFLRKALSILRNKEDAEDAVQESFTKIYLNASRFKKQEGSSFKSWAYKILINTCLTYYQRLKKKRASVLELSDEMLKYIEDPGTSSSLKKKEITDYIARILTQMPKMLSRVLHLHFIEKRPQKEISEIEGISVGAVKTRIYRAKKEFQKISDYHLV